MSTPSQIPRSYLELGQACVETDYLLEQKIFVAQAACERREIRPTRSHVRI